MKIVLNGESREVAGTTVAAVLEEAGFPASSVATAVNGNFVAREARSATDLSEGDQLEVLAPMQGG